VPGLVAASGGNAGLANAYAAAALGVPATVFVPENAPRVKVERLLAYNATVRRTGAEYIDAYEAAQEYVAQSGVLFCHAYDQPETAAGAGTIAEEILQDQPGIDTIVVAVGGGGLYAGLAAAAAGRAKIVSAEPVTIPTLHAALEAIAARAQLWSEYRIPAEYGAATALAALTSGAYVPHEDERVAVIVCGANTGPGTLSDAAPSPSRSRWKTATT
jgi:threonine dehydratase